MAKRAFVLATALSLVGVNQAAATLIFNFTEVAEDIQLVVSGNVDLNATSGSFGITSQTNQVIVPIVGAVLAGDPVHSDGYFISTSSWTSFGLGVFTFFDVSSGDRVALFTNPLL